MGELGRIIETDACVAEGADWLRRADPRFAPALDACGPLPLRRRPDGFAQLLSAIVSQQVSVASAAAIWARLQAAGMVTPEAIRAVDESALRDLGLSRQKAAYAGALAAAEIDFAALRRMPDAEVIATLVAVRGIGVWTAEIYAMFSLGRADVFAPGDLALQESARLLFGLEDRPKERALRQMAEAWSPWRSVAARALWAYYRHAKARGRYSMTRVLTSGRKEPASGELRSVVIFLHGYGANGADLLGLADPLSEHLPDTLFLAPDAPEACAGAPMGFQWFPIPWIDGSSQEEAEAGMVRAAEDLNAYLDSVMVDEDVLPEQVALFGFSQGTMMSLHVAPRREDAVAGVVGFSGRLLAPELLEDEAVSFPPVLLVHGDHDDVVPPQSLPDAAEALQKAGFKEVFAHIMKGTAHGIAPDGLGVALAFLRDKCGF